MSTTQKKIHVQASRRVTIDLKISCFVPIGFGPVADATSDVSNGVGRPEDLFAPCQCCKKGDFLSREDM